MAQEAPGPMQVLAESEAELLERAQSHSEDVKTVRAARAAVQQAESAERQTYASLQAYGSELLGRIYDSVTEDTDPIEYLEAVMNTHTPMRKAGTAAAEKLRPMQAELIERAVRVAFIGSSMGRVVLGWSAGGLSVEKPWEHAAPQVSTMHGIELGLPIRDASYWSPSGVTSLSADHWRYRSSAEPTTARIAQPLHELRIAASGDEVREAYETDHRPFSDHDYVMHHERNIKDSTGFLPVVAYGDEAVTELIRGLYERKGVKSYTNTPSQDDVLAAAINVGLTVSEIAEVDEPAFKERLLTALWSRIGTNVTRKLHEVIGPRRNLPHHPMGPGEYTIVESPKLIEYLEPSDEMVIDAVCFALSTRIARGFDDLIRNDHPDDRVKWWESKRTPEYRLLLSEAQELAAEVIRERYGFELDPETLQNDLVHERLAAQLADKQEEKARLEEFVRKNPRDPLAASLAPTN